ncbi:SGNH/GDSL hydrolase family protein [Cohnella nanjingensis]|uniref:SGNH/GDSL hydrolase family protein n=1 Tax=Cohnella nanjingensis TaxID=1387779 RepID=A0A7X0RRC2_9BACL|nr:SGNH/GDSL hydrolase family protein [Cohnella nanjingensis]MBB6672073.1 SGNH/GDSL hydrolase family protein [Cohnella nanjingensis]
MDQRSPSPWTKLVQFQHPEKLLGFVRHWDEPLIAALYGMDEAALRETRLALENQAREAAERLLANPVFAAGIDRLPFKPGETIVGIGESTTADRVSWLEMLRQALAIRRPRDGIRIVNEGVSGQTTTQILGRLPSICAWRPDWIFFLAGANDVARMGRDSAISLVSMEETARNLAAIRQIAGAQTDARWAWITPPLFDEARVSANPHFKLGQLDWRNADIRVVGDLIRRWPETVIDVQPAFEGAAAGELLGPDGIHPSTEGQQAILKRLVERLAEEEGQP